MKIKLRWEVSGEADLLKILKFLANLGKKLLLLALLKFFLELQPRGEKNHPSCNQDGRSRDSPAPTPASP